ncbi:MAG TPA: FAD-dependent oxidoreductase, partial [Gammaproteobacteria bacterium]|nr:FAD-dependent oxidoreductase [Gammaproteobacteria bacterium]
MLLKLVKHELNKPKNNVTGAFSTIAIIGTGAAGLSCGYHLYKNFDITVFEKNHYIGGHANTVTVEYNGETVQIDTAFVVFNNYAYPVFTR